MKILNLIFVLVLFTTGCSTTPISPDKSKVLNVSPPHSMNDRVVKLVNITEKNKDHYRKRLSYYTYEYREISNLLITGLVNTIQRAGGHIDPEAGKVITLEVERIHVSAPGSGVLDFTSNGFVKMRLQLGEGDRFMIKSEFSEFFPTKDRKDYLEDAMTGALRNAIMDILNDKRVRKYLDY